MAAFLVLVALAVTLSLATRESASVARAGPGSPSQRPSPADAAPAPTSIDSSPVSSPSPLPQRAGHGGVCGRAGIPVFPGSTPTEPLRVGPRLLSALSRRADLPDLHRVQWMVPGPDAFHFDGGRDLWSFYGSRMHAVYFWKMTSHLRSVLGVRTHGEVDIDPLLYVGPVGAALIGPGADPRLTLLC